MTIPTNTAKILRMLMRNTVRTGNNINQISKFLNISIGSAFKILKQLEAEQIAASEKIGNAIYYKLNFDSAEALKLCELILLRERRKLVGYAKLYAESIQKFEKARLIILFGSVLTKKEFNDVDALIITDKVKEAVNFCLDISKIRSKPVVPIILNKKNLSSELKHKNEALISAVKEGIILKGESVFLEVMKYAN